MSNYTYEPSLRLLAQYYDFCPTPQYWSGELCTDSSEETIVSDFCSICFNKFFSGSKECDQVLDKLCNIHQSKEMNHNMTACQPKPKLDYTDNGEECTLKCGTEGKISIL